MAANSQCCQQTSNSAHLHEPVIQVREDGYGSPERKATVSTRFRRGFVPIILAVIDVGILIVCVVINNFQQGEAELMYRRRTDGRLTEFYVPCDMVSLSFEEDLETFDDVKLYRDDNGTRICLFSNITAVVEKATERKGRQRLAQGLVQPIYRSCGGFDNKQRSGQYVAYFSTLSSLKSKTTGGQGSKHEVLKWAESSPKSFVGQGISYTNGRVSVDTGQFYFVYASVAFNKSLVSRDHVFILDIVTATVDKGVEYVTKNLNFAESFSDCPDGVGTAYVGSQVYLDSSDVLYVTVSDDRRVIETSRGNAFGIYAT